MMGAYDFIPALTDALAADPLGEKILLAPSRRVGRQWLDRAALAVGGTANARTATLKRIILDFADPVLRERGLRIAGVEEKLRAVGISMARLAAGNPEAGYFTRLPASLGLAESMLRTMEEVEAARPEAGGTVFSRLSSREKSGELSRLFQGFREEKSLAGLAGAAEIGRAALEGMARRDGAFPLLLVPESILDEANAMERRFLERWPGVRLRRLPESADLPEGERVFFAADSVMNEVREVLRRLRASRIPFDQVEMVCVDEACYADALCAAGLETFGGRVEDLPFTFSGGIAAAFSRPGRLLSAWLEWLELDLPPEGLARMLESGLMGEGWRAMAPETSAAALASRLRALPINGSPGDYRRQLGRGDGGDDDRAEAWLARLIPDIVPLANGGESLDPANAPATLTSAIALLELGSAADAKLDAYARRAQIEAIAAWRPYADWPGFNATAWLRRLAAGLRVMGLGPRPGRAHVADIRSGGHSGRGYAFVLGLDDGRFPGGVRQDPVLLDRERLGMSRRLPVSRSRRELRERAMARLLGRLRGRTTFSFARREGAGEREQFAAPLFAKLAAGAQISSVSLRPESGNKNLNRRDDWLHALLAGRANTLVPEDLAPWHPHLAAGDRAARERASDRFTVWDGHVPEAGDDFRREAWVLSPTHLEELAKCPLEFFFKRVLRIAPPKRYDPKPGRWLKENDRGNLLHDLFQDFLAGMLQKGEGLAADNIERRRDDLLDLLDSALRRARRRYPPRDVLAYEREKADMVEACVIFLAEEALRQTRGRPLCLEAALGGAKEDMPPWNSVEPVALSLPSGKTMRLQGRVDRIDRIDNHGGLVIWDYKTGRSANFSRGDPFRQGRHLQPYLYGEMLAEVVRREGRPEPVRGFSYFFPMPRDEGRTFSYAWEALRDEGPGILENLAAMLDGGVFPFTTDRKDVGGFSEYLPLYGDSAALAAQARRKTEAESDGLLAAWARLRGLDASEDDG